MSIEAMKLALTLVVKAKRYADECSHMATTADVDEFDTVAEALRQAIEQAQKQEPVAWVVECEEYNAEGERPILREIDYYNHVVDQLPACTQLYTSPPQRPVAPRHKPLTDEQIERLIFRSGGHKSTQNLMSNPMQVREYVELWNERIYKFAKAIEAAHGITGEQK